MIDVIERLQYAETRPLDADGKTQLWETLQDARAEITRLREAIRRLAEQDATLSVVRGNVVVEMDATPELLEQFSQRGGPLAPLDPPTHALADAARDVKRFLAMVQAQADELARLRLTDTEREVMEWVIARIIDFSSSRDEDKKAAVLRGLLERLGGER